MKKKLITMYLMGFATLLLMGAAAFAPKGIFSNDGAINVTAGNDYQIDDTSVLNATTLGGAVTGSSLTSVGTIATGTWSGTEIAVTKGGTGKTSITENSYLKGGAGNTFSERTYSDVKTDLSLNNVENTALSTCTAIGTIGTGTWEASVIDHERGGLEADVSAYAGLVHITGGATSAKTIGIADDNIVEIDDAGAADNEYAKFTANGLEGRAVADVMADLSGAAGAAFSFADQAITNVTDISLDTISSDEGAGINVVLGDDAGDDFTVDTD